MAEFVLSDVELELLAECCKAMDAIEALEGAIRSDGTTVDGSKGQPRVHPAVAEVRQQRIALGRLLAQLDLPDADGKVLPTPAQTRARKAAESRWGAPGARRTG